MNRPQCSRLAPQNSARRTLNLSCVFTARAGQSRFHELILRAAPMCGERLKQEPDQGPSEDRVDSTPQQAELITLRVGQDIPGLLACLSNVDLDCAYRQQPLQFGILVPVSGVDIDM